MVKSFSPSRKEIMPRRLKLSPAQNAIMVILEEAGEETINTLIATIKPSDLGDFSNQIDGLARLGLVRRNESDVVLTEAGKEAIRK